MKKYIVLAFVFCSTLLFSQNSKDSIGIVIGSETNGEIGRINQEFYFPLIKSNIFYDPSQPYEIELPSEFKEMDRQLAHYPYHVGQIVFLGKMLATNGWASLSIPKGNSNTFNAEKFSKPKAKGHFTDEFLNKKKE